MIKMVGLKALFKNLLSKNKEAASMGGSDNSGQPAVYDELMEIQDRNAALLKANPDLLFVFDKGGTFFDFHGNRDILLMPPEQFIGKKAEEVLPEPIARLTLDKINCLYETGEMQVYEYSAEIGGQTMYFESRMVKYGNDKALTIVRNITEQKKYAAALSASEKRYKELYNLFRLLADSTPDMIWAKDLEKKFLFANNAICRDLLNAKDTDEPIGKTDLYFATRERESHPENPNWHTFGEICTDSDEVTLREMRPMQFDEYGYVKGKFMFLDVHKAPLYDTEGKVIGVVGTARNVTEHKEIEEKLKHSEETYKGIINSISDCLYVLDENGIIIDANQKAYSFTGCAANVLVGKPLSTLLAPGLTDLEKTMEHLKHAFNGEPREFECWGVRGDGSFYPKLVSLTAGHYFGKPCVIALARDISEQKKIEQTLLEAKQRAEENDRLKTAFLANMSHETRIPLNGIIGFAECLTEGNLNLNQVKEYGSIILMSANRLLDFMTNVMYASKIEAGVENVVMSDFPLISIIEEVVLTFQNIAANKQLKINTFLAPECEALVVKTDVAKFQRILSNLLDNSIKFTNQGQVSIFCKREDHSIVVEVEDTGTGISEEHLERIFERFYQTNIEFNRGYEGAGLGLAIARGLVDLLGGKIWVKSQVGKGSLFGFSIPFTEGKLDNTDAVESSYPDVSRSLTVLVVEDDDSGYYLLEVLLTSMGCNVLRAETGLAALDIFNQNPAIDLVMLDIKLPEMDGLQVLKELKKTKPHLPVIAETAYAMIGDRERLMAEGFDEYVAKPIRQNQLKPLLQRFFPEIIK
ncbi:MAG: hypothetical protein PWR20_1686 [Bacteroidales bacterium]|jgi:PAS domain S-box-containing protein|nr:hypothetical protein [Bacteroidales bacterium]MDN5328545.1 hypothetical protein [Bacteroidales bacterium]